MIIDIGTIKRKTNFVYTDGIGGEEMCDLKEQFSLYVFLVHAKRASTHNQQSEYERRNTEFQNSSRQLLIKQKWNKI